MPPRPQLTWQITDPLGEALHALRMSGTFYCRSELAAPWGLGLPSFPNCLWFHAVTRGSCILSGKGLETQQLRAGDFALITRGQGHELRSAARVPTPNVLDLPQELMSERYSLLRHGGDGEPATLVCGVVRFENHTASDLIAQLPPVIRIDAFESSHAEWMQSTLRIMADEARQLAPGGETVLTRLADILVVQAIRSWLLQRKDEHEGWLGAFKDPRIGRALALVHRDPSQDWSVGSLASAVAMSRSAFAARFAELVGETPAHYVMRVRMRVADEWLGTSGSTVAEVATRLGYQSEAAFNRAFKRCLGETPGNARKRARQVESVA